MRQFWSVHASRDIMSAHVQEQQRFWKTLLEEHKVAAQLASISAQADGASYHISEYGDVCVKCRPASVLGDNFMSDTYIITATAQNGAAFRGFIKVRNGLPSLAPSYYPYLGVCLPHVCSLK